VGAREPDVDDGPRPPLGERVRGRRGGLDGAHPAGETAVGGGVDTGELPLRRGDHEHDQNLARAGCGRGEKGRFATAS
jgi:hypothetical protein